MSAIATRFKAAQAVTVNDMTRRFGYAGGTPNLSISPKYSGLRRTCVPGGELLLFAPGIEKYRGAYDDFKRIYPTITRTISPVEFQTNVRRKFYDGPSGDTGYRDIDCLTSIPYRAGDGVPGGYQDEAYAYFEVVHPVITCEFGLESVYRTGAPGNVGAEWFQPCPTCRLASLKSEDVAQRIAESELDQSVLIKLRDALIEANHATVEFANRQVTDVAADMERRSHGEPQGRTSRNEIDHIYLRMIHKTLEKKQEPSQQLDVGAVVAATLTAFKAQQDEKPVDPGYAEYLKWKEDQKQEPPKKKKKEEES